MIGFLVPKKVAPPCVFMSNIRYNSARSSSHNCFPDGEAVIFLFSITFMAVFPTASIFLRRRLPAYPSATITSAYPLIGS